MKEGGINSIWLLDRIAVAIEIVWKKSKEVKWGLNKVRQTGREMYEIKSMFWQIFV